MVDYLGSTINVVASSLGLVTVVICVLAGAGLDLASRHRRVRDRRLGQLPGVMAIRQDAPPTSTTKPRRLLTPSSIL